MKRRGINLLEKTIHQKQLNRLRKRIIRLSAFLIILFVLVLMVESAAVFYLSNFNSALIKEISFFEKKIDEQRDKESLLVHINDKIRAIETIFLQQIDYGSLIKDLQRILPAGAEAKNITFQQGQISFFLTVDRQEDLLLLTNRLKEKKNWPLVEFSNVTKDPTGRFSLNVKMKYIEE